MIRVFSIFFGLFLSLSSIAEAQSLRYSRLRLGGEDFVSYGNFQSHSINGATDSVEFISQAPEAATITKLVFFYSARGAGTPVAHKIGIQGINDSTGRANGTYKTGTGECSGSFTPPANSSWDGTWREVTLTGTTCALTRGERFSVIIVPTGTPDVSNYSDFGYGHSGDASERGLSYSWTVDAGAGTRRETVPTIVWKSASRTFGFLGFNDKTYTDISLDSSPDEVGMKFNISGPTGATYTVGGVVIRGRPTSGSSKTLTITLYDGTTVLQDVTIDTDSLSSQTGTISMMAFFDESSLSSLSFNSTYRVAIKANETSTAMRILGIDLSNADMNDFAPFGSNASWTERTDSGAWTDSSTKRASIDLLLSDMSGGGGGGAGIKTQLNGGLN